MIKDASGHEMWAIGFEGSAPIHDIHAAGLPIHVLPPFVVYLFLIHRFFPTSIGVCILVTGFIIVLYKSIQDLKDSRAQGF